MKLKSIYTPKDKRFRIPRKLKKQYQKERFRVVNKCFTFLLNNLDHHVINLPVKGGNLLLTYSQKELEKLRDFQVQKEKIFDL